MLPTSAFAFLRVHDAQLVQLGARWRSDTFAMTLAPPSSSTSLRPASEAISARKLIDHLDQAVLARAFPGELVPQDPNDKRAGVLLERIRAERAAATRYISA